MNIDYKMAVFDCPYEDGWPALMVTVNFTTLGATFPSDPLLSAVSIVVGLDLNIVDVLRNTFPIALFPDAHLLAGVIPTIRQQFKRPALASLGVSSPVRPSVHVFHSHPY
jgi:hypothetical protein